MPAIDRNVLRLAATSSPTGPTSPPPWSSTRPSNWPSAISTDDSGRFVNGVLAAVAKVVHDPYRSSLTVKLVPRGQHGQEGTPVG